MVYIVRHQGKRKLNPWDRYQRAAMGKADSGTQTPRDAGGGAQQHRTSSAAGGDANDAATLEASLAVSHKTKHNLTI